jgi:DNA modification methylase
MKPYYENALAKIYYGNSLELLPEIQGASAVVTDPPYELGFMGKTWDSRGVSFNKDTWQVIRNSCKSGAPLLSFGGTRTFHRIACAIEDGGWEYRDTIMWVYGSGFPKSLDIGKAIDKQAGVEREVVGTKQAGSKERNGYKGDMAIMPFETHTVDLDITSPSTIEAKLWDGYGTALKPAYEPIVLAMNPIEGTFANNALKHGVVGLNIDGCRVDVDPNDINIRDYKTHTRHTGSIWGEADGADKNLGEKGRFPANFIHDGSQMVLDLFPDSISQGGNHSGRKGTREKVGDFGFERVEIVRPTDRGSAARFFYCAKASKSERNKGCEDMEEVTLSDRGVDGMRDVNSIVTRHTLVKNSHPTVKPLTLMEYLCKLVKMPEYNLILDPFVGSGTTLLACIRLGIPCIGIDSDEKACEITAKRCEYEVGVN